MARSFSPPLAATPDSAGAVAVDGATLQLGDGAFMGSIGGGVDDEGVFAFDAPSAAWFSGAISGIGRLVRKGVGTLTLSGANTYEGGTTINSGAVAIGAANRLGTGGITFAGAGAALDATASFNFANAITVAAGVSADIGEAANLSLGSNTKAASPFNVGAGATSRFGSANQTGAVILDPLGSESVGANSALSVDGGFLLVGNALGATMIGQFAHAIIGTGAGFAILDLEGHATTLNNLSGASDGVIDNFGAATTLTLNTTSSSAYFGALHDGSGKLAVVITGGNGSTLTFGDDEFYTGGTTINSGNALRLGAGGTKGSIQGAVVDNGLLDFDRSNQNVLAGVISGAAKVEIGGAGRTILSGANTFQGGVLVDSGAFLDLANRTAAGTGNITFTGRSAEPRIEHVGMPLNRLANLMAGNCIVLAGVAADSAAVNASHQLVVKNGATTVATLQLFGTNIAPNFSVVYNGTASIIHADATVVIYNTFKAKLDVAPIGFAIRDTAAALAAGFAGFSLDKKVALAVVSDNAALQLSTAVAGKGAAILAKLRNADGMAGQVAIVDTAINVISSLHLLINQASHVASITFTDAAPPTLKLTSTQAGNLSTPLTKVASPWILDIRNTDFSWLIVGHGNGLTINDIAGVDTIIGGGASENFVFKRAFGNATILDFQNFLSGPTHDTITLSKVEFGADVNALLGDAAIVSGGMMISHGNDHLTLNGMTTGLLSTAIAAGDFKLV